MRLTCNLLCPSYVLQIVIALITTVLLHTGAARAEQRSFADRADLPAASVRSGSGFLTPETLALQRDTFANPGLLWVAQGEALFYKSSDDLACQDCHGTQSRNSLADVAARYPAYDQTVGQLVNLERRINLCRVNHQQLDALEYESTTLLSLTAYVASLSRGSALAVDVRGPAQPQFERGRAYFFSRRGQLNLACNQCHDDNWGRRLRGDLISQGHGNAFPAYRFEWQTLGSLHRRIRDCDIGVRAQPHASGSQIYTALELYLAWRARGLEVETPGIRR